MESKAARSARGRGRGNAVRWCSTDASTEVWTKYHRKPNSFPNSKGVHPLGKDQRILSNPSTKQNQDKKRQKLVPTQLMALQYENHAKSWLWQFPCTMGTHYSWIFFDEAGSLDLILVVSTKGSRSFTSTRNLFCSSLRFSSTEYWGQKAPKHAEDRWSNLEQLTWLVW